ncbi:rhodanese-related sulfurtransferase [Hyphomicrobium sp.]|jgi:UPF0176 protein|uniref:oxygen-dependent tRNA uridine(34) hydroxylase TrhO n=1 Tax=Hyphomicrobium sp. TaxID=82 RepID=UPI002D1BBBB8|nr:rhodanese-related sulfurtransferase [Hyphomicrobium sp.]HVZ03331.1 rhodanese-related sulfurtransferase [Hyphomicrobium sp.]
MDDKVYYEGSATSVKIAAFYKFVQIDDLHALRDELGAFCANRSLRGTILLAHEGINATVSGTTDGIDALIDMLRSDSRFADLPVKFSHASTHPFRRLKVKVKPEIVTFGVPALRPSEATGHRVDPANWNALISDPDVLVIDTRNDYEVEIGTFERAQNPKTRTFGEFRDYVASELSGNPEKKIAMFCTGGIRCEKASAYLVSQGFTNVHQLNGGILNYLERVSAEQSLWRGECFVFDERVALEHGVTPGRHDLCGKCGRPCRRDDALTEKNFCTRCAVAHATSSHAVRTDAQK